MTRRRVVVTGLGCVSPVGNTVADAWAGLLAGKSGIDLITKFDASTFACKIAGEVKGFDLESYMNVKEARTMDTFIHYGIAAASQAVADAGLPSGTALDDDLATRIGCVLGSGIGGLPMIEAVHGEFIERGARRISPFFVPSTIVNMVAGQVSIRFGFKGPNISVVTACTTGLHCIGEAGRMIEYGDADVMVAGGAESTVSPLGIGGFAAMRALSTRNDDPKTASRPWDKDRDGFVLGEGAGVNPDAVDYLNAHGTSTPLGDLNESNAIKAALGDHARNVVVNSTKSMTGHLLGGAGGIESVFTVLALHHQVSPPTINIFNQDPECDLDYCANIARDMKIDVALKNNFGFGGTNGSLVFKRIH